MRITPAQAAVLSARERQLLESRGPYEVKQLVTLIRRTRELRDKQRDLVQRQRLAATTRSRSKDSASVARTLKKEQLFTRALEHFEGQLQSLNRDCTEAMRELSISRPRAPRKASTSTRAGTGKGSAAKTAKAAKATTPATRKAGSRSRASGSGLSGKAGTPTRTRAQAASR